MTHTDRILILAGIVLLAALPATSCAQNDEAQAKVDKWTQKRLDREAKEREEAAYQSILNDADSLFEKKDYQAARKRYNDALDKKPGDTRVQAKIEDLDIIISNLAMAEQSKTAPETIKEDTSHTPVIERTEVPETIDTRTEATVTGKVPDGSLNQETTSAGTVQMPAEPVVKDSVKPVKKTVAVTPIKNLEAFRKELAEQYPDGITEETYKEGSATILKRIVVLNNRGNEYKKVVHTWGGVFYFKNESPTTERVWYEETEKIKEQSDKH